MSQVQHKLAEHLDHNWYCTTPTPQKIARTAGKTPFSYVIIWSQNNRENKNQAKPKKEKQRRETPEMKRNVKATVRRKPIKNQQEKQAKKETPSMKRK